MNVAWVGSLDPTFSRNERLAQYMVAAGINTRQMRVDLWPADRVGAFQTGRIRLLARMLWAYPWLLVRLAVAPRPDLYLISYPGWFDVPVVKLVARLKRAPVVFDVFISLYDTAISDRALAGPDSITARLAKMVDRWSIRSADRVIADCATHAAFLAGLAGVDPDRFGVVYVGADEVFGPRPDPGRSGRQVLFCGSYIPLQGVETIVQAALLMRGRAEFRLIGSGQVRPQIEELAASDDRADIEFIDRVDLDELPRHLAEADLVLGIFGTSGKADRVVPHKVFDAIASGRPVLTGATSAVAELFRPDEVATCAVGDPAALANAIDELLSDEDRLSLLAARGRHAYELKFSLAPQAERLKAELHLAVRS